VILAHEYQKDKMYRQLHLRWPL